MTKGTRSNESFSTEVGELRELMEKMIYDIGALAREVSSLKRLDQMIQDLQEQMATLEENQRDKTPLH